MDLKLRGKCAIVTGGTKSIGAGITLGLLEEGVNVVATFRSDISAASDFYKNVPAQFHPNLVVLRSDASNNDECLDIIALTLREFGKLNVLVNNAGYIKVQAPATITDEDFDQILHANLRSVIYMSRAAIDVMKPGSRIVNMSSAGASTGNPQELVYACSKAGIEAATRCFGRYAAPRGITANAVAPHVIDTGMAKSKAWLPATIQKIPLGRPGRLGEVVALVVYLCSGVSEYMTGEVVNLTGGRLMR